MLGALETLRQQIDDCDLAHLAQSIEALTKPALQLKTTRVEDENDLPLGASKFGGQPDLPPDYTWATARGKSLAFVGQINLADCTPFEVHSALPKKGILYFFNNFWGGDVFGSTETTGKVLYFSGDMTSLKRHPPADDLPAFAKLFYPCALNFSIKYTVPPFESRYIISSSAVGTTASVKNALTLSSEEDEISYWKLISMIFSGQGDHQMFGYPNQLQNDLEANNGSADSWQLLLQVDTDENPRMMWGGDSGLCYYWIKEHDLVARNFDRIICDEQGY